MASTSKPIQATQADAVNIEGTQTDDEKKQGTTQDPKRPAHPHHHHHHEPRIIRPASSGTSHLDPGAINIKP